MKAAITGGTTFGPSDPRTIEHFEALRYAIVDYDKWFSDEGLDLLIFPTTVTKTATGNTSNGRTPINSYSLPFLTVPMGVLSTGEPTTLGIMGQHKKDDVVLAAAAAYEAFTEHRIVSPLSPPLEGESFTYRLLPPPVTPPVVSSTPTPSTVPPSPAPPAPLVSVVSAGQVVGNGKNARISFGGAAVTPGPVESVTLTVNGQRLPVTIENGQWFSQVPLRRFKPFVNRGIRTVSVIILVRDTSGNVVADRRVVRLPVSAILRS